MDLHHLLMHISIIKRLELYRNGWNICPEQLERTSGLSGKSRPEYSYNKLYKVTLSPLGNESPIQQGIVCITPKKMGRYENRKSEKILFR
jgi:hypothetical protein